MGDFRMSLNLSWLKRGTKLFRGALFSALMTLIACGSNHSSSESSSLSSMASKASTSLSHLLASSADVCSTANEDGTASLACPSGKVISSIVFASYGSPTGTCGAFKASSCNAATSMSVVQSACLGKASCSVAASNGTFGDPCSGVDKTIAVDVICSSSVTPTPTPTPTATPTPAPAAEVCTSAVEDASAKVTCPGGQVITKVVFASYGSPTGTCGAFKASSCNAATSMSLVQTACVGKASCSVDAKNSVFGDPCPYVNKKLILDVLCGTSTSPTPTPTPVPSVVQQFSACANPYGGAISTNLGTPLPDPNGAGPFPAGFVKPSSLTNTAPTYTSNHIFWKSHETQPGDSVLMSGAFTTAAKTVRLVVVPAGTVDWQSLVKASAITVAGTNMSSTGMAFKIPTNFPNGAVYAFSIEDATTAPVLGLVNAPELQWAQGVPASTSVTDTLLHHVYTCGGEAGAALRLFGRDFKSSTGAFLQSSSTGAVTSLSILQRDENSLSASLPVGLAAGNYAVWVGTSSADATSSPKYSLSIVAQQQPTVKDVNCAGLVGDGKTDNTSALQACLNNSASSATDPLHLVFAHIPAGTYLISNTVTLHPYQYLIGATMDTTTLLGQGYPDVWIAGSTYFGMANLTVNADLRNTIVSTDALNSFYGTDIKSPDRAANGHVALNAVRITGGNRVRGAIGLVLSGTDIQVVNSQVQLTEAYITTQNYFAMSLNYTDGSLVSGNYLQGIFSYASNQNHIFEKNNIDNGAVAYMEGFGGWTGGRSQINRNIYHGYNTTANYLTWNVQAVTTDGGTMAYYGKIGSIANTSLTLAYDPDWSYVGTTNQQTLVVSIIAGTGVGQYKYVKATSGRQITLASAFEVAPDSSSVILISQLHENYLIAHNTYNKVRAEAILVFGLGRSIAIENNTVYNSGRGIGIGAWGSYYGDMNYQSTFNVEVTGNNLSGQASNSTGYYPAKACFQDADPLCLSTGIYLQAGHGLADSGDTNGGGSALSGILVRRNSIQAPQSFTFDDNTSNDTSILAEQNSFSYDPTSVPLVVPNSSSNPAIRLQGVNY
jgi:hypothetical protein